MSSDIVKNLHTLEASNYSTLRMGFKVHKTSSNHTHIHNHTVRVLNEEAELMDLKDITNHNKHYKIVFYLQGYIHNRQTAHYHAET